MTHNNNGAPIMTLFTRGILLASVLALAACGFHPVGNRPLPKALRSVHVELIDPYRVTAPPVEEALKARIVRGGGEVRSKPDDAATVLRLTNLQEAQEVLTATVTSFSINTSLRPGGFWRIAIEHAVWACLGDPDSRPDTQIGVLVDLQGYFCTC